MPKVGPGKFDFPFGMWSWRSRNHWASAHHDDVGWQLTLGRLYIFLDRHGRDAFAGSVREKADRGRHEKTGDGEGGGR